MLPCGYLLKECYKNATNVYLRGGLRKGLFIHYFFTVHFVQYAFIPFISFISNYRNAIIEAEFALIRLPNGKNFFFLSSHSKIIVKYYRTITTQKNNILIYFI